MHRAAACRQSWSGTHGHLAGCRRALPPPKPINPSVRRRARPSSSTVAIGVVPCCKPAHTHGMLFYGVPMCVCVCVCARLLRRACCTHYTIQAHSCFKDKREDRVLLESQANKRASKRASEHHGHALCNGIEGTRFVPARRRPSAACQSSVGNGVPRKESVDNALERGICIASLTTDSYSADVCRGGGRGGGGDGGGERRKWRGGEAAAAAPPPNKQPHMHTSCVVSPSSCPVVLLHSGESYNDNTHTLSLSLSLCVFVSFFLARVWRPGVSMHYRLCNVS